MGGIKRQIVQRERVKKTSQELLFFHVSSSDWDVAITDEVWEFIFWDPFLSYLSYFPLSSPKGLGHATKVWLSFCPRLLLKGPGELGMDEGCSLHSAPPGSVHGWEQLWTLKTASFWLYDEQGGQLGVSGMIPSPGHMGRDVGRAWGANDTSQESEQVLWHSRVRVLAGEPHSLWWCDIGTGEIMPS